MLLLDLIAVVLATDAIVTVWFYGSIFTRLREKITKKGGLIGELVSCKLCFSYHPSFWLLLLFLGVSQFAAAPWDFFIKLPIYSLAVTDLVHFLQRIRPINEEEYEDGASNETEVDASGNVSES